MNNQFWDDARKRWNGHQAFDTVNHEHISCHSPASGHDNCEIMIVGCADGRWYIEDSWGGDAKGADKVWNPCNKDTPEPYFFETEDAARQHAVAVVASICGVPVESIR